MGYTAYGSGQVHIPRERWDEAGIAAKAAYEHDTGHEVDNPYGPDFARLFGGKTPPLLLVLAQAFDDITVTETVRTYNATAFDDITVTETVRTYNATAKWADDLIGLSHSDKYHDDVAHAVYRAIAPYVTGDSFVDYEGEDDAKWRVRFRDGTYKEVHGQVIYPDDPGAP